jgi:microcystin-dependent protein
MTLYKWSQTASSDASADSTINWAEGQAPSSVNDSARAMMAATAKYRDDIAGAIVTSGTSTAYTVSSYQVFDTQAHMSGQMIAFTPHATNGATVTLNVDALGAKPLRSSPGVELLAGTIIQGTPYVAVYNSSDAAFYLRGFFGNPYNIPLGAGMDYWLPTAPNSSFVFPIGQAISRTTYSALFAAMGTTYGSGDGSTTFNLPDKTGRVSAMLEAVGTRLTAAVSGVDGGTIGSNGGEQAVTMPRSALPNVAPSFAGTSGPVSVNTTLNNVAFGALVAGAGPGTGTFITGTGTITSTGSFTPAGTVQSLNGSVAQTPLVLLPPLIVCNYVIRVI